MFRCEKCKKVASPGTPSRRVVVEARERHYALPRKRTRGRHRHAPPTTEPPVQVGWEAARTMKMCVACASAVEEARHGHPTLNGEVRGPLAV